MAMFDETLLESSTKRTAVLRPVHWAIVIGAAVLGYILGYFTLPLVLTGTEGGQLITQSIIVGVLVGFYAFMIVYTWSDSRHLGLSTGLWLAVVIVLNLIGFVIYLCYSASKTGEWKRATLPLAYIFEALVCGLIVLIPLLYTQELPQTQLMTMLLAPPPPPPPPPPPAPPAPKVVVHRVSPEDLMKAPTVIPKTIREVKDVPQPPQTAGVTGGVPGGVPGGSMSGVIGGMMGAPPPPPPPKPATPKRIRVGGQVEAAKVVFGPQPEYPQIAKMARVQGVVRLAAVISESGTIQDLRLISGPPLLVKAAMDAVSRWRYQPTLLNGDPVQVETEIDVNFTLQGE
jgi:periplasmic protein TonB